MKLELPRVVRELVSELSADKVGRLSAALAYFAIFALPGLLLFVAAAAGAIYGFGAVDDALRTQVGALAGEHGAEIVRDMLKHADPMQQGSWYARGFAIAGVVLGATGFLTQFQDALDTMWSAKDMVPRSGWATVVLRRALSFGMLATVVVLLVASLAVSAALTSVASALGLRRENASWLLETLNALVSVGSMTVLFAAVFKWMPRTKIQWREVWIGAAVTAVLVALGKTAIGLYLGRKDPGAAFGAAGPLAILLAWLYYFSLMVLLGAEFTQVYARLYGPRRAERAERRAKFRKRPGKDGAHGREVPATA